MIVIICSPTWEFTHMSTWAYWTTFGCGIIFMQEVLFFFWRRNFLINLTTILERMIKKTNKERRIVNPDGACLQSKEISKFFLSLWHPIDITSTSTIWMTRYNFFPAPFHLLLTDHH